MVGQFSKHGVRERRTTNLNANDCACDSRWGASPVEAGCEGRAAPTNSVRVESLITRIKDIVARGIVGDVSCSLRHNHATRPLFFHEFDAFDVWTTSFDPPRPPSTFQACPFATLRVHVRCHADVCHVAFPPVGSTAQRLRRVPIYRPCSVRVSLVAPLGRVGSWVNPFVNSQCPPSSHVAGAKGGTRLRHIRRLARWPCVDLQARCVQRAKTPSPVACGSETTLETMMEKARNLHA